MNTQSGQEIKAGRRASKHGQDLRALIDLILSFTPEARYYWIKALVSSGDIDETTAGRLIMAVKV